MPLPAHPPGSALDAAGTSLLSLATMEWLIEQGHLPPSPASPFGFLAVAPRQTTPEEQAAAAKRELGRRPPASLVKALTIAAQPEARIRLTTVSPGQPPQQVTFLRRVFSVVQAGFNAEGFLFSEPMQVGELEALLVGELSSEAPSASTTDRLLAPRALALLTALWPQSGLSSVASVAGAEASAVCQRLGADEATARGLMDDLVASEFVKEKDAAFRLDDEWRPWLDRVWSGVLFEVEATLLPDGPFDAAQLIGRRERLVFLGPRGRRIVSRAIDAASLDEIPLGVPLRSDQPEPVVMLSHLDDRSLQRLLSGLLRLTEEGLRSRMPGVSTPAPTSPSRESTTKD